MSSRESTPSPVTKPLVKQDETKKFIEEEKEKFDVKSTEERDDIENTEEAYKVSNADDLIDMNTFEQLLDMDDEDDHEFSYSIVNNYFEQAEETFKDMDKALAANNLTELSSLGHFLKGSSAAIGLKKVQATCEKIQNIGSCQGPEGKIPEKEALERIAPLLPQVKLEYAEAEEYLKNFYEIQDAQ